MHPLVLCENALKLSTSTYIDAVVFVEMPLKLLSRRVLLAALWAQYGSLRPLRRLTFAPFIFAHWASGGQIRLVTKKGVSGFFFVDAVLDRVPGHVVTISKRFAAP